MHGVKLRVHITPLGFEVDRSLLPLIEMKADRVWLILKKQDKKVKAYKERLVSQLSKAKIEYKISECEIVDLYDVLKAMRLIIEEEAENDIFINVSSGTKIEAIAGMMASMIFKDRTRLTPYYVVPNKYLVEPKEGKPLTEGLKEIQPLPTYRIEQPKKHLIKLLQIIEQNQGAMSKKRLIEEATTSSLITVGGRNQTQSKYMSLNKNYGSSHLLMID